MTASSRKEGCATPAVVCRCRSTSKVQGPSLTIIKTGYAMAGRCKGPSKVHGPDLTMKAKMSLMLSTMIPGSVGVPTMVCVFPEPVAPYAKTVVFSPSSTPAIKPYNIRDSSIDA